MKNDIEQSSDRLSTACGPRLSYHKSLNLHFVTGAGQIKTVKACTPDEMLHLVEACILTARNPETCLTALCGLNYSDLLSRWYALLELKSHGAILPLYTTAEAALQSLEVPV